MASALAALNVVVLLGLFIAQLAAANFVHHGYSKGKL
jgi:hypothetical protein